MDAVRFYGLDTETLGLNKETDPIIQIGGVVTDAELNITSRIAIPVWGPLHEERYHELLRQENEGNKSASIVLDMHTKNGLLDEARSPGTLEPETASLLVEEFYRINGASKSDPVLGSSVHFDREFLRYGSFRNVDEIFSHRNIDVSSFVQFIKRVSPSTAERMEHDLRGVYNGPSHLVLTCLSDTVQQLRWIKDNTLVLDV